MINNSAIEINRTDRLYRRLFIFTIFYMATYSSSLWISRFSQPIFGYIRYILIAFMLMFFLYRFIFLNKSRRQMAIVLALLIFFVYNLLFHYGIVIIPILVFCMYASYLSPKEIIQSYAVGLFFCVLFIVSLSLVGVLPMKNDNNLLAYGFSNPNGLGGLIAVVFMSYLYLHWKKSRILFLMLYIAAIFLNNYTLDDRTAALGMSIFLFFYMIRNHIRDANTFGLIGIFLPILLTIISLLLAYLYGKSNWVYNIDHLLTRRIYIWNYYLNISGIHLFPNSLNIIKANEGELDFYGKNINVLLTGSFDGGYMFLLLRMGIINTIAILYLIGNFFNYLIRKRNISLEILLLIFIINAFTENTYVAPYGFYASYLIVICFSSTSSFFNITDKS